MSAALSAYLDQLRTWLDLPDPSHVLLVLGAAATKAATGEPLWMLLVAPPSSGKTEAVGLLSGSADARLDDITPAGLLGWTRGRESHPSGVLTRVGQNALITIGDLSTLLAASDRGSRDEVFALLRRAYDGEVTRDISPPGKSAPGARLHWSGRITAVGAVTAAIDRYAAHNDELGARWVYFRIPERDTLSRRRAARAARGGNLEQHRRVARESADILITAAMDVVEGVTVADRVADEIEDAALVTCWGRASVPRHGYGKREIDGIPTVEEPPRVTRQLLMLARGLLALGLADDAVIRLARQVAADSMPASRLAVLGALADVSGATLTTAELARSAQLNRNVAYRQAEELEQIGLTVAIYNPNSSPDELDGRVSGWRLAGQDATLVEKVISQVRVPAKLSRSVGNPLSLSLSNLRFGTTGSAPVQDHEQGCAHPAQVSCVRCYSASQRNALDDATTSLLSTEPPPDPYDDPGVS